MEPKNAKKSNSEVLFIVNKVNTIKFKKTDRNNFERLYNLFSFREINQIKYKSDFCIIDEENFVTKDMDSFKLIIVDSREVLKNLNTRYKSQKCEDFNYQNNHLIFKNFENKKIIVQVKNFIALTDERLKELKSDIQHVATSFYLENDTDFFNDSGVLGKKNRVHYQFICNSCNTYNLKIINKTEPKPSVCKYCKTSILDANNKLKFEVLVLKDGNLNEVSYQL